MARILKPRIQSHIDDATPRVAEPFFGALYSSQHYEAVRRAARAGAEQFGKIVWAHVSNRSQLREAEIVRKMAFNKVNDALETVSGQATLLKCRRAPVHCVTPKQIHRQRVGQRFAVQPSRRRALIEVSDHGE